MRCNKWYQVSLVAVALLSVFMVQGCSRTEKIQPANVAKTGDTVKVDYTLKLDDGTVYDTSIGNTPFEFTLGAQSVIPGFEEAVLGMKVGQTTTVKIAPKDGYGERKESLVQIYDRKLMPEGLTPEIGMPLQAQNTNGTIVTVTITAFDDQTVTVDANLPLAGKNLNFTITLLEIVAPTTTVTTTASAN